MPIHLRGIFIIAIFLAVACTPLPELRNDTYFQDTSLLSGEPCFAPCWRNLIPGETSWNDAEDTLSTFDDVANLDRIRDRETDEEIYSFHYQDSTGEVGSQCCRIYSRDGETLTSILLLVAPEITVGDVIAQYGEPQYLQGDDVTNDQTFVTLVYPETPMLIYAFGAGIATGEITPESEIIGMVYMSSLEMAAFLNETSLYTWDGFDTLSEALSGSAIIPVSDTDNSGGSD